MKGTTSPNLPEAWEAAAARDSGFDVAAEGDWVMDHPA